MTRISIESKRIKKLHPIKYPAIFPGLGRGLDLLLILFFYQEKAAAAAGEVCQVHNGESHVPGQLPRPRQRP